MIRRHTYSRSLATLSMAFALIYPASGVISYTVGGFTETFDGVPPASDWRTSFTVFDAGGITNQTLVYNTIADLDAAMTGVTAASINSNLGDTSTDPPSIKIPARYNTTNQNLQMSPTAVAASVLLTQIENNTGATVPAVDVGYTFGVFDNAAIEQVPGWRAYYSTTGDGTDWTPIPAFDGAVVGERAATLTFDSGWAVGSTLFIAWLDDNAPTSFEDAYTLDNFQLATAGTLVPEPSSTLFALLSGVLLFRRKR